MTEELKQKAEANYKKHSEKLDKLWNGALYSEGALFGYNEATKELQKEKETCWKECEYSKPKAEIIQSYISEKAKVKELRQILLKKYKQIDELFHNVSELNHLLTEAEERNTKAKDLLAKWVELYKPKSNTALPTQIQVDTEQFLKEQV